MRVAIIGCGLIGEKRARALGTHTLTWAADTDLGRAQKIAAIGAGQTRVTSNWQEAAAAADVDIVIVATTNDWLTPISLYAVQHGKHVLVEKPAARSHAEITPLVKAAAERGVQVKVGFNLRYHPALRQAKAIIDSGAAGELMFLRGRYGHGGRIGYDQEWRADRQKSGGGELIDQGVHLIDLSRWFLGEMVHVYGFAHTYFWNMAVDDNGFAALRTKDDKMAWLSVSCSEWKNMFCLEIYGKTAKLQIDGLGGSYGTERLSYYHMRPEMGPPDTTIWEYPGSDRSWQDEYDDFCQALATGGPLNGDIGDAAAALDIVARIYASTPEFTREETL